MNQLKKSTEKYEEKNMKQELASIISKNNFLSVESIHGRTESSSGGLNSCTEDQTKNYEINIGLSKLKEDNDELLAKLSCVNDTMDILNKEIIETNNRISNAKLNWSRREQELLNRLEELKSENEKLNHDSKDNMQYIKKLNTDCTVLRKMYNNEETKAIKKSKELQIKSKRSSADKRTTANTSAFKINQSSCGMTSERSSTQSSSIRTKTPFVRIIGKETISNHANDLFL